jgi:peptide/nickel transport system substrate-binding protein
MEQFLGKEMGRRTFLGGSLMAGAAFLAACGASGTSAASKTAAATGGSPIKTLRVGVPGDVLLAGIQRFQASNQPLRRTVFDYLVDKNVDGSYIPRLAKSFEWSSDKKKLVLTLRDGVTYHTGRSFGADDVIGSVQAALATTSGAQAAGILKLASGITKTGPLEVTATFDNPFPGFLDAFAMLPVIDPATYADAPSGKQVIGTGPFTWTSYTAGSKFTMTRNESYWQHGKPYLDTLEFTVLSDPQAMLSAMQSSQVDMVDGMVTRDAATLKKDPRFTVYTGVPYDIYLGLNTAVKPFDDVRVRQAIAYALDRKRIASQVYNNLVNPSSVPWSPQTPGVTKAQIDHYRYDVSKAKSLLSQAGASGATVSLTSYAADPGIAAILDIVQYGLTQIGLKVELVNYDATQFASHIQAGNFPGMWVTNVALTAMGPVTALTTANPLTTAKNTENFVTDDYKSKVAAVTSASSADQAKAIGALTDFMLEQAFHNSVVQGITPIVAVKGLTGVTADLTLASDYTNARLSK